MDILGRSPISLPVLIVGKAAFLASSLFFCVRFFEPDAMFFESLAARTLGVLSYAAGVLMVVVSVVQLGKSTTVGLPERPTELKTDGLYRLTRNPIYVGGFLMCAGSCLFSMHPLNLLLAAIAVAVHLRVVSKEERFLEERFGARWLEYKEQVPRFFGRAGGGDFRRKSA